ncbi:hypothetical protein [Microvirga zambiensis]|uniref:hypothetical protein n=1 Tax=Microvirga zambiensis TaxID=1402137 RepID=UPI00191D2AFD|nr:hypothetical protein [Microvirga zambiensis]
MAPRPPPETPNDESQDTLLLAVHTALNDAVVVNAQTDEEAPADTQDEVPPPEEELEDPTRVEADRIEAYLRGPTAFSA